MGDNIQKQLKSLRELQEEDRKIHELQKIRDAIPEKIQEMRSHLEAIQVILEKERNQLNDAERFRREQEREMKVQADSLQQAKSKTARNTKEYNAVQRELEAHKKSKQEREEEILKLMSVIEESSKSIATREEEYKKLLDDVVSQEKAGEQKIKEFDKKLKAIRSKRQELTDNVSPRILARYNQILKRRKDGIAVVGARGGSCLGCYMHLPPQLFNIVIKSETFELCPSCHRILFFSPAETETTASK